VRLGYEVKLEQSGERVTGVGRKIAENGSAISPTPISVAGTIQGDRLMLTFTERSAEGAIQGKLVLLVDDSGTMRGRFSTTDAQSSGTVEAHRVN
jgi:hypothetical protein